MTESTCLHIQDRESGPIRVVELPWISVRIGRAAHCEVRLTEHELPDEVCRLQRRGQSWRLVPCKSESPILLEGRRPGGSCLLPFNVPFRVGQYCLTLRHDRAAEPDWEIYSGPAPQQPAEAQVLIESWHSTSERPSVAESGRERSPEADLTPEHTVIPVIADERPLANAPPDPAQAAVESASSREPWDTRWKALGAQVKARAEKNRHGPEIKRPAYQSEFEPVPLREPRLPLIQPAVSSTIRPTAAAVRAPAATKLEPTWARAKPEPAWRDHQAEIRTPLAPAQQPWQDLTARETPVQSRQGPLDVIVLEDQVAPRQDEVPVEIEPVPVASAPDHVSFSTVSVAPAESVVSMAPAESVVSVAPAESVVSVAPAESVVSVTPAESVVSIAPAESVVEPSELELQTAEIDLPSSSPEQPEAANDTVAQAAVEFGPREPAPSPDRPPVEAKKRDRGGTSLAGTPRRKAVRRAERAPAQVQPASELRAALPSRDTSGSLAREVEWPSAKDILATHRAASPSRVPATNGKKATKIKVGSKAIPTLARAPAHWAPPVWLAGPAVAVFVLAVALPACVLSWLWARDSYTASIVTDRLLASDGTAQRRPLPDSVTPPEGGWTRSTPAHLANWAIFLSRFAGEDNHSPEEPAALLERALQASPINATARLARAQLEPTDAAPTVSLRGLGLSRDAASLAWSARRLMAAGKKDDALKLYGRALSVALPSESSRAAIPRFSDDPGVPRYLLPGEEQVREIVRELVSSNAWTFLEWSGVLPDTPIVLIAAARLLREQDRGEAEAVLDRILNEKQIPEASGTAGPVTFAARAEAFALRSRWSEANQLYRQAIESTDDATIQRSWWFNFADISFRLDDETQRQAALQAASAVAYSDDITRRAADIQRATRARSTTRSPGVKAN